MTSVIAHPMAWSNERLKLSCVDNIGLKNLWKMIILDNTSNNKSRRNNFGKNTSQNNLADYLLHDNRESTNMSRLNFLAIKSLKLSVPATPLLLQQNNTVSSTSSSGWLQLAGHPESIAPADNGIVRKRISGIADSEAIAYRGMSKDVHAVKLIPKFQGIHEFNGETYLELQDLLHGFKDPAVIDIKMGRRTFLESEVKNDSLRPDLYKKMLAVNPSALTENEHRLKAITKLRYMLFREQLSSSECKGFRIEALKLRSSEPVTDLKTVKSDEDVDATITHFLNGRKSVTKALIKRLKSMRQLIEKSEFFQTHEIVGSSIFIVYDNDRVGAWLIDFAKTRRLPEGIKVDHRKPWVSGNCEEGLLHGIDQLINVFSNVHMSQQTTMRKFLM